MTLANEIEATCVICEVPCKGLACPQHERLASKHVAEWGSGVPGEGEKLEQDNSGSDSSPDETRT